MRPAAAALLLLCSLAASAAEDGGDYPRTLSNGRGMVGVWITDATAEDVNRLTSAIGDDGAPVPGSPAGGAASGNGVRIVGVIPGSLADRIGMRPGDVVTSFNGQPVGSARELYTVVRAHREGDDVSIDYQSRTGRVAAQGTLGTWKTPTRGRFDDSGNVEDIATAAQRENERSRDRMRDSVAEALANAAARRWAKRDAELDRRHWSLRWRSAPPAEPVEPAAAPAAVDTVAPVEAAAPDATRAWTLRFRLDG